MKIAYVALKYDYGNKGRGFSFEHNNFYESLRLMDNSKHEVLYFPFDEVMQEVGYTAMNEKLIALVKNERPDLVFFSIFNDEISKETLKAIRSLNITKTFNWFTDDHWRFVNFSKHWCWFFDYIGTTDSQAVDKYRRLGYNNVIKTQWACNHRMYKPHPSNSKYEITFVGQAHGMRESFIKLLMQKGLNIECFGSGWPNGRVSQEKMIEIFSNSKINLNLSASSDTWSKKALAKIFFFRRNDNSYHIYSPLSWISNIRSLIAKRREQIKGRVFEVPGTGGFLMTSHSDNLEAYYKPDQEIAVFNNADDLIEKARYYLTHDSEREKIAAAGYERTLNEHTYDHRFREIFKAMNLPV